MYKNKKKDTILILGASGFIGEALYKELSPYFNTYGTYNTKKTPYIKNNHYYHYSILENDLVEILEMVKPDIVISALRGPFNAQIIAHSHLFNYTLANHIKIIFLSSSNVFDAYSKYPSYELDKTLSHSVYGLFKIKIENLFLKLPKQQIVIARLPMVFGSQSPRIKKIKHQIKEKKPIEIFPNLVINVTNHQKITQQIHYIINRKKHGVFHLGSNDLVHHDDFIKDIITSLKLNNEILKRVYTTNEERYLAVLPKYNVLSSHLQLKSDDVLKELQKAS